MKKCSINLPASGIVVRSDIEDRTITLTQGDDVITLPASGEGVQEVIDAILSVSFTITKMSASAARYAAERRGQQQRPAGCEEEDDG